MKLATLQQLQPKVFERFRAVLKDQAISHAYLFSGALGSFEMALMISQALFCERPQDGLPCQECRTCRLIEQGEFSDVTVVSPQGNLIKTETIRELVKQFSQSGFESNRQVFIIKEAEKMHANAANSLLKSMEEPQSEMVLFLLTQQEEQVLPTIRSRSQLVSFASNPAYLQERIERAGVLKEQARIMAQLAQTIEEADELASSSSFAEWYKKSQVFVQTLLGSPQEAYLQVAGLVQLTVEKAEQERLLTLLTLQAAAFLPEKNARNLLTDLVRARDMWKSNVSLHNSLEYLVLKRMG